MDTTNNVSHEMPIKNIKVGKRFRKDIGDINDVAEQINIAGLLQPIGVTPENELVFGFRRLIACRDILGWKKITVQIVNVRSDLDGQVIENCCRKDFTICELVEIVDALRSYRHGGDRRSDQWGYNNFGKKTVEQLAKQVGLGGKHNYHRAKRVVDNGVQELIDAMNRKDISVAAAAECAALAVDVQKSLMQQKKGWSADELRSFQQVTTTTEPKRFNDDSVQSINLVSPQSNGLSSLKVSPESRFLELDVLGPKADKHELFPTPKYVIQALLDREKFEGNVWEPACGNGAISEVLCANGYKTTSTDIVDRGYGKIADFLRTRRSVDNIVTNPPFSLAEEFVRRSLISATKRVAMFLPMAFYSSERRFELWRSSPLQFVYVFTNRVSLYPGGDKYSSSTGRAQLAWFIWNHGYEGEPVLRQFPPDIPTLAKST